MIFPKFPRIVKIA